MQEGVLPHRLLELLARLVWEQTVLRLQAKLRKLDVIEGLTRLYAAQGMVPGWVYDLKGRILRDEL